VRFEGELIPGTLVRRFKRFLAEVRLADGSVTTTHCPNPGSMKSCLGEGWPVLLSSSTNPRRKLPTTLEMIHNGVCWIGVNTHRANGLAATAIEDGTIAELQGFDSLRREVRYGDHSRIDLLLERGRDRCWVEVKNVTLVDDRGRYAFPDAVTTRGRRHLRDLAEAAGHGHRAAMLFVIQRSDGSAFTAAEDIDPDYADELRRSVEAGVQPLAYRAEVTPRAIEIVESVPIEL
jgi:sugar fermentation stimulation protein A